MGSIGPPGYLLTLSWFPASGVGGVNQAVINLARVMFADGRRIPHLLVTSETLIPPDHPHLPCSAASIYLRAPDLPAGSIARSFAAFLVALPKALDSLRAFFRRHNIQTVAAHFPETESIHFALLKAIGLFKGRFILSFHGEDIRIFNRKARAGRLLARWMMRRADAVVACSAGLRDDLLAFEPSIAPRAHVIYNAIDIPRFLSRVNRSFVLPVELKERPFLLNIARYEHKKGQDVLLQAFEQIANDFPDLMLVMIGTSVGDESKAVKDLVASSPVRTRIMMLENVPHPDVGVFLEASKLFVLPSRREGFPFVLLEAGAMRKPVVATACLGVPEIVQEGVTGRLTPVDDAPAFAAAIVALLHDQHECRRLGENLFDLVAREFSWDTVFQKHLALIE